MKKFQIGILIAIIAILATPLAAEVSFRASVNKVNTAYEDKVLLDLEVTVSDVAVETKPLAPPTMLGFRIGGSVSSVTQEAGNTIRHYQYELIPARSGPVEIPAFALEYSDSISIDTLYSQPITVTVAQPIPVEEEGETPWAVLLITAAVLVVGVVWWINRQRATQDERGESEWQTAYRNQLIQVLDSAERQNYREFFDSGSRLLIGLLSQIHDAPLKGKTVDDLSEWLAQVELPDDLKTMISSFLKESESVKFTAGHLDPPSAEVQISELKKIVERLLV